MFGCVVIQTSLLVLSLFRVVFHLGFAQHGTGQGLAALPEGVPYT